LPSTQQTPIVLELAEVWTGFRQLLPISMFVIVFGLAFWLAAMQKGLDGS